jgi:transcriptional regulator with XRE-family HTH domain
MPRANEYEHSEVGKQFTEKLEALGLTQNKAANLAGISRRHLIEACRGANVTLHIVKRLMGALQIPTIRLDRGGTLEDGTESISVSVWLAMCDQMEKDFRAAADHMAALKALAQAEGAKPNSKSLERAAALARDAISNAPTLNADDASRKLPDALIEAVDSAEDVRPRTRRRRR